jgi:hypothetical protein
MDQLGSGWLLVLGLFTLFSAGFILITTAENLGEENEGVSSLLVSLGYLIMGGGFFRRMVIIEVFIDGALLGRRRNL